MLMLNCDAIAGFITAALGLASFSLAGLYCNHADISPRYAPVLLGLTNTAAAVPGIIGVTISGAIYDQTGSWPLALFAPSVFFFLTGSAVFTAFGCSELQDFSNTQPFAFEAPVQRAMQKLPLKQAQAAAYSIQTAAGSVRSKVQPLAEAAASKMATMGSKLSKLLKRKEL